MSNKGKHVYYSSARLYKGTVNETKYNTFFALNDKEALEKAKKYFENMASQFDLIVTDLVVYNKNRKLISN